MSHRYSYVTATGGGEGGGRRGGRRGEGGKGGGRGGGEGGRGERWGENMYNVGLSFNYSARREVEK